MNNGTITIKVEESETVSVLPSLLQIPSKNITHLYNDKLKVIMESFEKCKECINELKKSGYWKKIMPRFTMLVDESVVFYAITILEIEKIINELLIKTSQEHIDKLLSIYRASEDYDLEYGRVWHQEYIDKDLGNRFFDTVEDLYIEGRSIAAGMLSLSSSICHQISNFK